MLGRYISPTYLAGVAVAALAHAGMAAGFFLMDHASGAGRASADPVFVVTLVDLPVPETIVEQQPAPDPEPEKPEVPAPEPVAELKADAVAAKPEPVPAVEPPATEPAPAQTVAPPASVEDAVQGPSDTSVALIEETPVDEPAESAQASSALVGSEDDGAIDMDAYVRGVRQQLARHAPKGVAGARNCEVEFRLSRTGEVVFVGIRTSSGSPLYDRRCLKSVTAAVPFPAAPAGATAGDLSFTIVMKQKW
ncbi:MAG TPA: TonB C-terminal domain-containing protein [Hyphomonas sp.]|nr:TonB C-terminal domain-containing protein [Hyphomonas sp.]HRX73169.1 TonB C-terminal domain-containing protein [Hyphomonas sp.]